MNRTGKITLISRMQFWFRITLSICSRSTKHNDNHVYVPQQIDIGRGLGKAKVSAPISPAKQTGPRLCLIQLYPCLSQHGEGQQQNYSTISLAFVLCLEYSSIWVNDRESLAKVLLLSSEECWMYIVLISCHE